MQTTKTTIQRHLFLKLPNQGLEEANILGEAKTAAQLKIITYY